MTISKLLKSKTFRYTTQAVGCISILYYTYKLIYYILANYWSTVVTIYLIGAETFAFTYMSLYVIAAIHHQAQHRKHL